MSRIGRLPIPIPAGVDVTIDGNHVAVKGPKGKLERDDRARAAHRPRGRQLRVERPDDDKRSRELHGLTRTLIDNMVVGVTDGLPQGPRDHRRGLSRPARGHEAPAQPGLQPPDRDRPARGHRVRGREPRPAWRSWASTRSWSATSPRASARRASPSPTRARASATRARSSAARPARPARSAASDAPGSDDPNRDRTRRRVIARPERGQETKHRRWRRHRAEAPRAASATSGSACAWRGPRRAAAGRVPQPQPDLRPGHRRHAAGRTLASASSLEPALRGAGGTKTERARAGGRRWSPSAPGLPASSRSSSTAPGSGITADPRAGRRRARIRPRLLGGAPWHGSIPTS